MEDFEHMIKSRHFEDFKDETNIFKKSNLLHFISNVFKVKKLKTKRRRSRWNEDLSNSKFRPDPIIFFQKLPKKTPNPNPHSHNTATTSPHIALPQDTKTCNPPRLALSRTIRPTSTTTYYIFQASRPCSKSYRKRLENVPSIRPRVQFLSPSNELSIGFEKTLNNLRSPLKFKTRRAQKVTGESGKTGLAARGLFWK